MSINYTTSILSAILHVPPSAVDDPTTSFNPSFSNPSTAPPFCHLITKICQSLHSNSSPAPLEQTHAMIATNTTLPCILYYQGTTCTKRRRNLSVLLSEISLIFGELRVSYCSMQLIYRCTKAVQFQIMPS